jgi:hypothetical protein
MKNTQTEAKFPAPRKSTYLRPEVSDAGSAAKRTTGGSGGTYETFTWGDLPPYKLVARDE